MRTQEEIAARVAELKDDLFPFERLDLLEYLDYEHAKPLLKPDVKAETWPGPAELSDGLVRTRIAEYMDFALSKAEDHRGISASRSVAHMRAWLWLLGDQETLDFADVEGNYENYGVPILRRICEKYEIKVDAFDDPESGLSRMSRGERCCRDCEYGCGT